VTGIQQDSDKVRTLQAQSTTQQPTPAMASTQEMLHNILVMRACFGHKSAEELLANETSKGPYEAEKDKRLILMCQQMKQNVRELESQSETPKPASTTATSPIQSTIALYDAQGIVAERQSRLTAQPQQVQAPRHVPASNLRGKVADVLTCLECVLCLVFCIFPTD
jgi:hypothetical protein